MLINGKFVCEGLVNGRNFLLVARDKNRPIGFAYATIFRDYLVEVTESAGVINDLYMLPSFRRKGVGKKLVRECLKRMKMNKVNVIRLTVLRENEAAIKLYEKLGFKICRYTMMKSLKH
jgi:ribosomal protein S18 acetylase RimI-like enzyme